MSSIITAASSFRSCTSIIHRSEGGVAGLREIIDDSTRLSVYTFPFAMIEQAAAARPLSAPACYVLSDGRTIYIGETANVGRRLSEHAADPTKSFAREVFVVSGFDDRWFDKTAAVYFQYRLTKAAEAARFVEVTKGINPRVMDLPHWRLATLNRIVDDAERLLFDAGCRAFHSNDAGRLPPLASGLCEASQPSPSLSPSAANDDDDRDNGLMHIGVSTTPIGCEEYELVYGNVWARGYPHGSDFIVAAGSEIRVAINPSVNPIIHTRRKELIDNDVLMMIPGVADRWRLSVAVAFQSISIAAKVVCGAHVNRFKWQPLRQTQPVILAM